MTPFVWAENKFNNSVKTDPTQSLNIKGSYKREWKSVPHVIVDKWSIPFSEKIQLHP